MSDLKVHEPASETAEFDEHTTTEEGREIKSKFITPEASHNIIPDHHEVTIKEEEVVKTTVSENVESDEQIIRETTDQPSEAQIESDIKEQSSKTIHELKGDSIAEVLPEEEAKHEDDILKATEEAPTVDTEPTLSENEPQEIDHLYSTLITEDIIDEGESVEELMDLEAHPLDELSDQQVIDVVNEVEAESRHLELENILFENFLRENDPSALEGLDEIMNLFIKKTSISYVSSSLKDIPDERPSLTIDRQRLRLDSYTSITSIAEGRGPKINLSQKTDMLMRAMEESQANLESFLKKSHITKRNLKSELEEFSIREAEITEATDIFEYNVVTQGLDKLTQRIPAEKFVRYMDEWLKSAQLQIEKLRLRIATLKVQYKKVSQQLIQRQELGENVHAVDFDQLEIENKHFIEKIEQKNLHLIELKKMNGGANLVLSTHKKFLQKQQEDCNKIIEDIAMKTRQIKLTEIECEEAEKELKDVYEKYEYCKNLKSQYTVPDVMEYVRLKGILHDLRKNVKIWIRRRKIQDIALNTCLREMKNLTGSTHINPEWFKDSHTFNDQSSEDDIMYQ